MMKVKNLVFVTVAAMSVVSGAHAAIDLGSTGNGELWLTAFDRVAKVSYTRDLGYNLDDFLPAAMSTPGLTLTSASAAGTFAATTFGADAQWADFVSRTTAANVQWNVAALDAVGTAPNKRVLSTVTLGQESIVPTLLGSRANSMGGVDGLLSAVNTHPTHNSQPEGAAVNVELDGSAYADTAYGDNWSNFATFTTTAGLGGSSSFFTFSPSSTNLNQKVKSTQYGYTDVSGAFQAAAWTLAANGQLSYKVPPAIPVPAAVWLLGSALVGLVGVARRRSAV